MLFERYEENGIASVFEREVLGLGPRLALSSLEE
jgi:hypothetical protein